MHRVHKKRSNNCAPSDHRVMFDYSKNLIITGGTFTEIRAIKDTLDVIAEKAAPGAFHCSDERSNPPRCSAETRVAVIQDLMKQIGSAVVSCIIWLYGPAGAGKSSIAQTIAEICDDKGLLIGCFFFFRSAPLRNNAKRLAASLVYQLGRAIPSTVQYMTACIQDHPAIFESSLEDQLERLLVEPLRRACMDDPAMFLESQPKLLILDGLDECNSDTPMVQQHILEILGRVLQNTPIPIVILIASRPEIQISCAFEVPEIMSYVPISHVGLVNNGEAVDIAAYVIDEMETIKRTHHLRNHLPLDWPRDEDVNLIAQRSSGQFIFAATLIEYIKALNHKPHERLQAALESSQLYACQLSNSPFRELDALYMQIFASVKEEEIVALLAILYELLRDEDSQHPRTIAFRLRLAEGDVEMYVSNLVSLVKYEGEDCSIRVFHASLREFLCQAYLSHVLKPGKYKNLYTPALDQALLCIQSKAIDAEILQMIARLTPKIPKMLEDFQPGAQHYPGWVDIADHEPTIVMHLCAVAYTLQHVDKTLAPHTRNHDFWNQCVNALDAILFRDLSMYLSHDKTACDFLTLAAFLTDITAYPPKSFTLCLEVSEAAWLRLQTLQPFVCDRDQSDRDSSGLPSPESPCLDLLQQMLLNGKLSAWHRPERFAHLALKCLDIITSTTLSRDIPFEEDFRGLNIFDRTYGLDTDVIPSLYENEVIYLWAVRGLSAMLRQAPRNGSLINGLQVFDCQLEWLENCPEYVEECEEAVERYLKAYSKEKDTNELFGGLRRRASKWFS